jgi:hypothetical protein
MAMLLGGMDWKDESMEMRDVVDYRFLANIQNPVLLQISYKNNQLGKLKSELKSNFIRLK